MTLNMKIITYWNIISRFTNPDTGEERDSIIAFSLSESYAKLICHLLNSEDDEPNRIHIYHKIENK